MIDNKLYSKIVILSNFGFIIFSTLSMFFYPGGGEFVGDVDRYYFTLNYFSDLGFINPIENRINPTSPQLFAVSLVFFSLGQICFYLFFIDIRPTNSFLFVVLKITPLVSSVSLILVGVSPSDIVSGYHFKFVVLWIFGLFVSISVILIHDIKNHSIVTSVGSATVLVIISLFSIQSIVNLEELNALRPLSQKLMVYSLVVWFIANTGKKRREW